MVCHGYACIVVQGMLFALLVRMYILSETDKLSAWLVVNKCQGVSRRFAKYLVVSYNCRKRYETEVSRIDHTLLNL